MLNFLSMFFLIFVSSPKDGTSSLLPDEKNNIEVYQKCNAAVVNIATVTLRTDFFFEMYPQEGMGSGSIITPDGYILTNFHVVGSAQRIEVTLSDNSSHPAQLVGRDPDTDLAVLKINPKGKRLVALEFGDSESLAVGQKTLAIGNPFGLGGSLTVGIISSLGRDIRALTKRTIKDVIQTDAAINPGNSGGPLLDSSGKLIGTNTQILSRSGGSEGIGFAIPVKIIKKIVPELIQYGEVLRPKLGIEGMALPSQLLAYLEIPISHGVMITALASDGAAQRAGLRKFSKVLVLGMREIPFGGDVIYQIDDKKIATLNDIQDVLFEKKTGESVVVHYIRNKKTQKVTIKF